MTSLPSTAQIDKARDMSDEVTAYVPLFRFGRKVGEMTVHCRANWDEALGGLTADVLAENSEGDRFPLSDDDTTQVLTEIQFYCPDAWRDILAASGREAA